MAKEGERALHSVLAAGRGRKKDMSTRPGFFETENSLSYRDLAHMPLLFEGETHIRYHPLHGTVILPSYRPLRRGESGVDPERVIGARGEKPRETQARLRLSEYSDVETAIRGCLHVLETVGRKRGTQVHNVTAIARHIAAVVHEFSVPGMTVERVEELAGQTQEVIGATGYIAALKPNKQRIAEKMFAALEPDSLGRPINNLRTTVMLASAWTLSHEENIHASLAQVKWERFLTTLIASRGIYRHSLERMKDTLVHHLQLEPNNGGVLVPARAQLPPSEVPHIVTDIARVSRERLYPFQIKLAPYRQAGLAASYAFFGPTLQARADRFYYDKMMHSLLGDAWFEHITSFQPLPTTGIGIDDPLTARDVVSRGAFAARMIDAALLQGEQGMQGHVVREELEATGQAINIYDLVEPNMV
ncbi:hypothetical protein A3H80_01285 [Candidatus Roizmanbacteria bacterium RIFCSPLOWO2_02_FULL_37_19]|uniref:Uncharacterized protein n=1 Tax=Candidatus Roizmanbacteria bacterium RIFCSPHIGHO2_02_FULL_37_24 TaxID=1802037 RepID=A0A1F7GTZ9_9BACT|nr:MAG: hypothetical protein A2862_00515 [Candidatus Roizmanbacteria bacterium RIFCSPHIGHO2_01_FULL_38_41]OGK22569.1 MAG: hypothetical protein A3C24_05405 [Candidatus Roizmanbacteria bacterium RIFCSPHIGHO2_02_FULL_37_24]OGK32708.1 MAG: hypothetical protein A3E10_00280 [Candidatus Roizmanbacteria bacterium RIFCSPHIGHO2_12_FULL_37_23]OGK54232.1 MAG: hypothetical protein A3H80_01285 [Candidatus Roizmanbacteria bacterium RIFCSPLOWO2_02_FULL_37_19]